MYMKKFRSGCLTGKVCDGSILNEVNEFFQNGKFWTHAQSIRYGNITNSLLSRVGITPGLHGWKMAPLD